MSIQPTHVMYVIICFAYISLFSFFFQFHVISSSSGFHRIIINHFSSCYAAGTLGVLESFIKNSKFNFSQLESWWSAEELTTPRERVGDLKCPCRQGNSTPSVYAVQSNWTDITYVHTTYTCHICYLFWHSLSVFNTSSFRLDRFLAIVELSLCSQYPWI